MEHNFKFTDIDCLIILESLNYFIVNEKIHPLDKDLAMEIENEILKTIREDKESNNE